MKAKPSISNPNLLQSDRNASIDPWIEVLVANCKLLEKIRLKRMIVTDQSLEMISIHFPQFKSLILSSCYGFSVAGLSIIASNCSKLEQFEVERCAVTDTTGQWLSSFPETLTSLKSLNISCIKGVVNPTDLERLVARSPNLTSLSVNKTVSASIMQRILMQSPPFVHLGVGSTVQNLEILLPYFLLALALERCHSIQSVAFFYVMPTKFLHAIYPICPNLVFVNLRFCARIPSNEQVKFIKKCSNLRRLYVRDCIGDEGIKVVSRHCEKLEDLKIYRGTEGIGVTEIGLTAISTGCPKLKTLTYFCTRMTNIALISFSKNCPNITSLKLIISNPKQVDYVTLQPFDYGFGAIVKSCKNLNKLTISGLLTDDVFLYIGMYAEKLEALCVMNGGESEVGMQYVYNGCKNLRKAEISKYSFVEDAILAQIYEY